MKTKRNVPVRSAIAIALALAFPAECVLADEVKDLTSPDANEVSVRAQYLDSVNPQYRLYSGMDRQGGMASMDINLIKRDEDGVWVRVQGRELGLRNQEIGASVERQGDWRVGVDSYTITKYAPYTLNTKVTGVGNAYLALNTDFRSWAGQGDETSLKLERKGNSLSGSKFISDNFKVSFGLRSEDKNGAIMSAAYGASQTTPQNSLTTRLTGTYGTQYFVPQPENYRHNQFDVSLDYFTRKLQLSAGFYLSMLDNANVAMNVTPGQNALLTQTTAAGTPITPANPITSPWISLPPSNRAQNLEFSGAYNFTDLTRLSFKMSQETATQDAPFIPAFGATTGATYTQLNPPGVPYAAGITNSSLGGLVETATYFTQLTTKLSKDLGLLASWRYEDRNDKTPQRNYLDGTANPSESLTGWTNPLTSHKINRGRLELTYRLPAGYSVAGGVEYDKKETPEEFRDYVTDQTTRVELRKAFAETINGRIMVAQSNRTGSDWHLPDATPSCGPTVTTACPYPPTTFSTITGVAAPLQFVDRKRDKVKFMADWAPIDPVSVQVFYEYGKDAYLFTPSSPYGQMGMTDGRTDLFGLDASYRVSDNWKVNGFYSFNQNKTNQNEMQNARIQNADNNCSGTPTLSNPSTGATTTQTCIPWQANLDMTGEVLGLGMNGTVSRWLLGAQYMYSVDRTKYGITVNSSTGGTATTVPVGAGVLPDTVYSINRLRLSGTYPISKATRVRIDYSYDLRTVDDYTWASWTFSDGTKVNVSPTQTTQLMGVTVIHSF